MNLPDIYDYLIRSRRDLWGVLESVPEDVLTRPLVAGEGFHTLKNLVMHTATVEDGWLHGDLLRAPPVLDNFPALRGRSSYEDVPLADLLDYWRAVEGGMLAYLSTRTPAEDERVVTVEDWPPGHQQFQLGGLLWHVLLHEVRHTAQMCALLRMQGVVPPSLDLLFYLPCVAPGRSAAPFINQRA